MIRGGSDKRNVTVWEAGEVGGEYVKAFGHYHILDFVETYKILEGEGVVLLQERKKAADGTYIDDEIVSFRALTVKAGDSVTIPPFHGHLLVNTGPKWLVTTDDSPFLKDDSSGAPAHADYEPVRRMGGFAYYFVNKDGKPALVKNPKYISVPDASIE
jgi:oxalate decarboxylase/phosphoglucose isomerase-like protein (cupin superfamily)